MPALTSAPIGFLARLFSMTIFILYRDEHLKMNNERKKYLFRNHELFVRCCFLQKVHLGDDHPTTTVPLDTKIVEDVLWRLLGFLTGRHRFLIRVSPFLVLLVQRRNNFSAGKTSYRDNHMITCMISASSSEHHAREVSCFL